MSADLLFDISQSIAMVGWALIFFIPNWKSASWLIMHLIIPILLGLLYVGLLSYSLMTLNEAGGFGSLEEIRVLFKSDYGLLAGWVHYLAFDLFVGSWILRHSQEAGTPRWMIIPAQVFTLLAGPFGLLVYALTHIIYHRKWFTVFPKK